MKTVVYTDDSLNVENFGINGGIIHIRKNSYHLSIGWNEKPSLWYLYDMENGDKYDNRIACGPFRINTSPFKILAKALHIVYEENFPDHIGINATK